jgi:hypothetical protein
VFASGNIWKKFGKNDFLENCGNSHHNALGIRVYRKSSFEWWSRINGTNYEDYHLLYSRARLEYNRFWHDQKILKNEALILRLYSLSIKFAGNFACLGIHGYEKLIRLEPQLYSVLRFDCCVHTGKD